MGWGNGMAIGWPMTSSSRGGKPGWFKIQENCKDKTFDNVYSQQLLSTDYSEGDYVFFPEGDVRVLLGPFFEVLPDPNEIITISGPAYTGCPIYRAFTIDQFCNGGEPYGCTSQIDITYYNTGDYVYSPGLQTRVRLGAIVPEGNVCMETIPVEGPKYNSCEVNPPFTGYFGFNQYCDGSITPFPLFYGPTTQNWQIGQVVRIAGDIEPYTYVIINQITTDPGDSGLITLVGPALNGCPV